MTSDQWLCAWGRRYRYLSAIAFGEHGPQSDAQVSHLLNLVDRLTEVKEQRERYPVKPVKVDKPCDEFKPVSTMTKLLKKIKVANPVLEEHE